MPEPIAVIGSGCRFPGGADTPSKLWSVIHHPEDLSRKPSRFNIDPFYHPVGTHHGTTNATKSYWLEDDGRSNVTKFDAGFFNIQPGEVDAMDPQQRLLLEVVYDALCAGGQPMEQLRGSDTAVYVGMMCDDYNTMLVRDWESLPRYAATGLERAVVSNRVSYFFDWHGPSMTIDTACSSSMVALDMAVQALRSGKSTAAVAAGTSLILSPAMYISESNLGMLSPTGRCAMWDVAADGYSRGEGVAAVILKTLSQALADNDPIDCIIRETAVNQDGRTPGLTMPSNTAQAALIHECYTRAGLDPVNRLEDRPQFFHAHGTGTQAGDPQEAEAIATSLFPVGSAAAEHQNKLIVGSIKTVIGHTEGTAGLASLIGTSQSLRHGIIPPNLHFHQLNPKVAPFFDNLHIPTAPMPWVVPEGQIRRASVNSFGFGGTNAHCILEEYAAAPTPKALNTKTSSSLQFTPLTFSAASETALKASLSQYLDYLKENPSVDLADLAYTLQHRRSTLHYRKAIPAPTAEDAIQALHALVNPSSDSKDTTDLGTRFGTLPQPAKILGIFTGQGAQWPRMGAQLIESSPLAAARINDLDASLQRLPNPSDRPPWTLKDQLLAGKDTSRIAEAALSQPLCTAVQVILVDILRAAGITFAAVVGHSSGEIGAAYAAGLVTADDAIRIAYFRGVHAKLAASPDTSSAPRGAMLAVGASLDEARALCEDMFSGRLQVAAVNSASSVTLSGDEDAVDEAETLLKAQSMFARKLKVDTAYHSAHMATCAGPYLASLEESGVGAKAQGEQDAGTVWYSSVVEGQPMTRDMLANQYWVDNMCNAVLFAGALASALEGSGPFDLAVEVGPHPALKGPATSTIGDLPYTGVLSRGLEDVVQLSAAFGFVWTRLGFGSVRFSDVQTLLSGNAEKKNVVLTDLPAYPYDRQRTYWAGSRVSNHFQHRSALHAPNPVLGSPCTEATTPGEFQWRNMLCPNEMAWLKGHMLQGQTVFPATGYVSMAIEAVKAVALEISEDAVISVFKVTDVDIPRAIAFDSDDAKVETVFSISSVDRASEQGAITAEWTCYMVNDNKDGNLVLNSKGRVTVVLAPRSSDTLPVAKADPFNLVAVGEEQFYANLESIGYGYSTPFRGVSDIRRKPGYSIGTLHDQSGTIWEDSLVVHPGMLDSALQTVFASWSYPKDTQLWSLHVPVSISSVTINAYFTPLGEGGKQSTMRFETLLRERQHSRVTGDVYLNTAVDDNARAIVQLEGITLVPFSPATSKLDLPMFSQFQHKVISPDGELAAAGQRLSDYHVKLYKDIERVSYWFARNASLSIPLHERQGLLRHFQQYLGWCDRMVEMATRGIHPKVSADCNNDSREDIARILVPYKDRKDVRFVEVVGDNLVPVIREGSSMLEHMNQDGLLRAFYEEDALCGGPSNRWLSRLVAQIGHRYPGLNIFEIGAGTGATTASVLRALGGSYSSYTFTDISSGFFMAAEERFADQAGRMSFKTFDMEKDPSGQRFTAGTYDVVVAVNVLHVSADMEASLANVRRLLKPGGYLLTGELTSTDLLFTGMTVGTLPGWWIGVETGRPWGPLLNLSQWDALLRKTGFAGLDTVTPDISTSLPMSVFAAQAVNDQVMLLREPLAAKERPADVKNDGLAIIGGVTWPVYKLGREVCDVLDHRWHNKQFFDTIQDFVSSPMAQAVSTTGLVSVLCLTDLDRPYLEDLTADKFAALQALFASAGTLVWVTRGSTEDSPFSYAMKGILHTVKTEVPSLNIQLFDLDPTISDGGIQQTTATDLAVTLLRHHVLFSWGIGQSADADHDTMLWTAEPEVFIRSGRQLITRLLPDLEKNARYNARRRDVWAPVNPANERVELVATSHAKGKAFEVQKVSPLRLSNAPAGSRTVRVTHSLLQSIAISGVGFLKPTAGLDAVTGEAILALAGSSESLVEVPAAWCIPLTGGTTAALVSTLLSIAADLVAEHILSLTPYGSTLVVHDADANVQSSLASKAVGKEVNIVFATSQLRKDEAGVSHFLHPNFPRHTVKSVIPASAAVFVSFSRGAASDAVRETILKFLPPGCFAVREEAMLSHKPIATLTALVDLTSILQKALDGVSAHDSVKRIPSVPLADVPHHTALGEPLQVVDWTSSSSVAAKVQPIDSGLLFHPDKTYFFAGMAGDLGQSLAEWMIVHGARFIVLTSRNPKVNPQFTADMSTRYGANVQPMSVDVTSLPSLQTALSTIRATLPPIAGVVNGAMILDDDLLANMTYTQFTRATTPKITGTILLDQVFGTTPLDFFIVASSIASVIGFAGQSNYSAANEFMTGLVRQRRARGLVGSAMSIPGVLGLGYAANQAGFDFDYFRSIGYVNIAEEDLHLLFAEAVLSGRVEAGAEAVEVAMGVDYLPASVRVQDAHKRDVRFGHFVGREEVGGAGGGEQAGAGKAGVKVKVLLQAAKTADEAYVVIRDAFVAHLKRMLRLGDEGKVEEQVALIEQGVDSLVAVDIRSWFLKEVAVDVPTLKVLGGGSVADLVTTALEKMPDVVKVETEREETASVPQTKESPVPTPSPQSRGSPVFTPAAASDGSGYGSGATTPSLKELADVKTHVSEITEERLLAA
ncbi:polyketide synthase [Chaetomium fimeti]|uniref:Polyketide synthase n=1 Tax=Chaetomium fimeti TaxID=1854472 RepID=A0AAE0HN91_9PEZI|nr:polyketide synthase [Chaetomium fimeti]